MVAVYAHLAGRMPITGYAYQWSSRLVGSNFGWFTGWIALVSFLAGTSATSAAIGTVFAPEIWENPTTRQIQALSIGCTILVGIINIVGVKIATRINNLGASIELIGTIVLAIVLLVGLFVFFKDTQGPKILLDTQPLNGNAITLSSIALAALLPVYVLLGWEGAADLAEETLNPRRAAPRAMFRAVIWSGIMGFGVFALLSMAMPNSPINFFQGSENPVLKLVGTQVGGYAKTILIVVAFASIFACLIANMAVATRMTFALSRDNMLPASKTLQRVGARTKAPVPAIVFVTVGLTYYLTYGLTMVATAYAERKGRIPAATEGAFSLGRWLNVVLVLGLAWCLAVIGALTLPAVNNQNAITLAGLLALGTIWWAAVLRRRLKAGTAGPPLPSLVSTTETHTSPVAETSVER